MPDERLAFGPFTLDPARETLSRDGRPVSVGHKGLLLLQALLRAPGQAVEKASLMDAAWPGLAVEDSNLSVQIAALRKLLGTSDDGHQWIATVPRVGYRFVGSVDSAKDAATAAPSPAQPRPSIVVLPFSLTGDGSRQYLADGITEDIITSLARFRWFRVAARNSSFALKDRLPDIRQIARELGARYVLEGSIRHAAPQLRISVQLIDAVDGHHVWAERYDLQMADAFAIQDEIAERVAGAIEPELLKTESRLAVTRHTGNMTAWDLVRQGTWHFHRITREGHVTARELFRQACAADQQLPESHIWLARVSAGIVAYGWSGDRSADIAEGLRAAAQAVMLDAKDPYAHYSLAIVSGYGNAPKQAIRSAEKAIELSPSFALGHLVLGMARLFDGQARAAVGPLEHGIMLNAHDPQNFAWHNLLAYAHLFAGEADAAIASASNALKVRPTWRPIFETLVCCYATIGRPDEARRFAREAERLESPAGDALAPLRELNPEWSRQIAALLARATAG
jgi:TolB-like protein